MIPQCQTPGCTPEKYQARQADLAPIPVRSGVAPSSLHLQERAGSAITPLSRTQTSPLRAKAHRKQR